METVDVAIIGFGPVGATLANLLADCGLSILVLEREAGIYPLPRAVHFDDEVMRVFQTLGLADRMLPHTHVSPGMRFVDAQGRLVLDWSRSPDVGPLGWNVSYRFHQPDLERVLRDAAGGRANIDVRLRAEAVALDQDGEGVTVGFEDLRCGAPRSARARYVVGCDGARSLVRRLIGSAQDDLGFHEPWLVVDAILERDLPSLGDHSVQYCDPVRPATYVRGVGRRRRWEIALLPTEDPLEMTAPDKVWRLLERFIARADARLERAACYTFHSVIAARWRDRRLLVAGDAAHQTPPFLGQGMCAGIRDVANLAWKLARVVRREAADSLLDSYQGERAPHVRAYIELAVRLGGLINTRAAEAAVPGGLSRREPARMETIKPLLGAGLGAGIQDLVGQVAPQPILADGTRLDDHVGYRFAALLDPSFHASLPDALLARLQEKDVAVVTDPAPALQAWLATHAVHAVVVRPDRYVLGAARSVADMAALVAAV
ncbi:bifunctional 3-(3-hydroxy-phenyl)propionate/3-hydroxycinnamic acid hydroxylase [Vineibacter terrae]|uniref:bifunctional 3-(3-hydroxy-phenyl)propionate/3-hydroxycinnamic acid hydroxylase MhpA n=1 Tax=Vineibacter terrae TaxID=2586908 RepID=UPI002E341894|nr:bifunctional 3-(3-hydroxy-phenyl)propionate/3-hydroxycinnamic acid hydroxylase [Vineibacter terrae]HEX2885304.1 bifunctional 3-(3-hydroxy-phenyl)propionate/3-hydroxycinnamic acid hydroxylase [Vineibacter terrae]